MSYVIKKTDGNIVATITDGTVDKASTSITLIGKNYKGIGEIYNTNLVRLLENFSNSSPPNNQIKGQLWFNSNTSKLNVFDGTNWRPVGSPFVTKSRPGNLVEGDLWIDSASQQLKFFDGANLITAGPIYTYSQGKTGWAVEEIVDNRGNTKIIASMYVSDIRMAILNPVQFTPLLAVAGFTTGLDDLKAGLSFSTLVSNNTINAPSQSTLRLIDSVDGELESTSFVRSDKSGSINGSLIIQSDSGVTIGASSDISLFVETGNVVFANQVEDSNVTIQTRNGDGFQNSIVVNSASKSVTIYPDDTWSSSTPTFRVNGNTTIEGTLTVVGATEFTNSTTLQVTDKNIELAVVADPTTTTANGAGITVLAGTGGDKTIQWLKDGSTISVSPLTTVPTWELNDNVRIPNTNAYYIGNNNVLTNNTLGPSIVSSSLTTVGDLVDLTVAKFNLTDNILSITDTEQNLEISVNSARLITLTNRVKIRNVANPAQEYDVANKTYVDRKKTSINYLTVDITGLAVPNVDLIAQLNALLPMDDEEGNVISEGDIARVLCLSYTNTSLPATQPTVSRVLKVYRCEIVGGNRTWVHQTLRDVVVS